jgi:2-octaprenyl-6-methoxyphenol hydroxylase
MSSNPEEIYSPITIVGGGLVGLALAIALAQAGQSVTVLDKTPLESQAAPEFDGRVCAISLGSQRLLENIGVWQYALPYAEPILDILVQDNHSPVFVHYDHQDIGAEPMGHILENRHTRMALEKRAAEGSRSAGSRRRRRLGSSRSPIQSSSGLSLSQASERLEPESSKRMQFFRPADT